MKEHLRDDRETHEGDYGTYSNEKIDRHREALGLRKIKRGERQCLRCDKKFISEDFATHKMCETCAKYSCD